LLIGVEAYPRALQDARVMHLLKGSPTMAELIDALKSPDRKLRSVATDVVANMAVTRTSKVQERREGVELPAQAPSQIDTADALADRERLPELVAALVDVLTGSDFGVGAADALGALGPDAESAIPALEATVRGGFGISESENEPDYLRQRKRSYVALARIGSAGTQALIELVTDENPYVRREAASSLGMLFSKPKAAVAALIRALQDDDEGVRTRGSAALRSIDPNRKQSPELE
jgi:HEAT repeat protein